MGVRLHNAYAALKDALFDYGVEHEGTVIAFIAWRVLDVLPMTKSERELYSKLFG